VDTYSQIAAYRSDATQVDPLREREHGFWLVKVEKVEATSRIMILKMAKMTRQTRDAKGRGQTDSIISSAEQQRETLYTGISKAAN
jgi:hypothetical protein